MPPTTGTREQLLGARPYTTLRRVQFDGLDLRMVVCTNAWFDRCTFVGADLRHATLDGCSFKLCDISGGDLRGASLRSARFAGCDLRGADLRDCELRDTAFGRVNTRNPDNAFTDVTGALWTPGGVDEATFDRVRGAPG